MTSGLSALILAVGIVGTGISNLPVMPVQSFLLSDRVPRTSMPHLNPPIHDWMKQALIQISKRAMQWAEQQIPASPQL
jgi:hypothetical protein